MVLIAVVLWNCFSQPFSKPPMLDPLLAVPPALAGIGAASVHRPLTYGVVSMLAAGAVELKPTEYAPWLPVVTMITVFIITAIASVGTEISLRQQRKIADVTSIAEVAQRALLRPLPARLGPLSFGVVYLAAQAEAKVGGDLYEAVNTAEYGIRVIIGDVRGKGLDAVELAADVLGMFRELAHDACTLGELAARLDAGLARDMARHEEFVTALLVEIDPDTGRVAIFNCGHPSPLLISAPEDADVGAPSVSVIEVPSPAPPLGLLALGEWTGAEETLALLPNDQLLLYTDGVTEARDASREFYPLPERVADLLIARAASKQAAANAAANGNTEVTPCQGLLDLVRADLLKHTGEPLHDDAAMLLVRAPALWSGPRLVVDPPPKTGRHRAQVSSTAS
jgi:serine phosphatase RsbU (regulator of sigma subunit)